MDRFYRCRCFLTHNIFLSDYRMHVEFHEEGSFLHSYRHHLKEKGCSSDEDVEQVIFQIKEEIERRRNLDADYIKRKKTISDMYQSLHPELYILKENFLAPSFVEFARYCRSDEATREGALSYMEAQPADKIYSFPVFTQEFCSEFIKEINHFESSNLPKGRPNTMNNHGILMDELGFDDKFLNALRKDYLNPITKLVFPECGGGQLDSHRSFIVSYEIGKDVNLSYHYDNAEVTLNVCLGDAFCEGKLYFGGMTSKPLDETVVTEHTQRPTIGILHRGKHMHGALPITSGKRVNLIIWMRSSAVRNRMCPMCNCKPVLMEALGFGDGFTNPDQEWGENEQTVNVCSCI